ncbi:MAG: polyprenyl synthetase family protein [Actinomycetes bacterium]
MPSPEVLAVLESAGPSATATLVRIENHLADVADRATGEIAPFVSSAVAGGGKRLRPLLAVLSAGLNPSDSDAVVRAGVAAELVHAATLVHDDILDRADARRGAPTVVASGGREMAVAVGDYLFAAAFGELVPNGTAAVEVLAQAGSDLARGELLQRADAWNIQTTRERYLQRCRLKTARLFEAAAVLGSRAGGLDSGQAERFAGSVGVAFQLLDDVLDVTGPEERTGKPRGTDLLDGTVTLPLIIALERDSSLREVELASLDSASVAQICDRIAHSGALDEVREMAEDWISQANQAVGAMTGVSAEAFHLVARALVDRVS